MVAWFYFIIFVLALAMMGSFLLKNKNVDTGFILLSILVTVNCLGRYMLATAGNLEMAIWANKFLYVGASYAPLLTVLILGRLCDLKIPNILSVGLTLYSTVIMGLVLTIGKSGIYYKHVKLGYGDGYNYLIKTYGPLHILYPVMMMIYALMMIIILYFALKRRKQISIRLVTTISVTGFAIVVMYILERLIGLDIDFVAMGYLIGIVLMIKYFERAKMYDMSTNISSSIERLNEYGYIAFDDIYRYAGANSRIKELFPEINTWVIDKEVDATDSYLYKEVLQYLYQWDGKENTHKYINVKDNYFQLNIRHISYGKRENVGYLVEFIDRTIEKKYYNTIEEYNSAMEKEVTEKTEELRIQQEKIKKLFMQTVTALSEAVDAKDRYTSGHSKRVAEYSRMIAERLGKSKEEQDDIYRAGLLHDIGKIRIPAEIINKPGKLTDEEYSIIKIHPETGYHILRGISDNSYIAAGAKYHHERYDGKGYPNGFAGEKIPEVARILGVADAYDAMASNRSYRNVLPQEVVRSEIENGKGTQFDPLIADIMLKMIDEDKEYTMRQPDSVKRTILVVDDEALNNKIITNIMRDEPMYEMVYAESGKEALEILKKQSFDLIMLDVLMPAMNGLETLKMIKEKYQIPVVLMTSDKSLNIPEEFSEYGYDDCITKPFHPLIVKEVVHCMTK